MDRINTLLSRTWSRALPSQGAHGGGAAGERVPSAAGRKRTRGGPASLSPARAHQLPVRFLSTVPWAQRLRTCCTDRLIMEWSPPSAFIFPGGRPPPSSGAPGGGGEARGAAAGARLLQAAAAAGGGCGAPGWALLQLPPTGLRRGPLSESPRQPPPRRGDIEDSGRGEGRGPGAVPARPPSEDSGGGGRCRCSRSGAAPRRGGQTQDEAEVTLEGPGGWAASRCSPRQGTPAHPRRRTRRCGTAKTLRRWPQRHLPPACPPSGRRHSRHRPLHPLVRARARRLIPPLFAVATAHAQSSLSS